MGVISKSSIAKRSSKRQKFQIRREKEVSSRLIKVNSDSKHGGRYAKGKTKGKLAIVIALKSTRPLFFHMFFCGCVCMMHWMLSDNLYFSEISEL